MSHIGDDDRIVARKLHPVATDSLHKNISVGGGNRICTADVAEHLAVTLGLVLRQFLTRFVFGLVNTHRRVKLFKRKAGD